MNKKVQNKNEKYFNFKRKYNETTKGIKIYKSLNNKLTIKIFLINKELFSKINQKKINPFKTNNILEFYRKLKFIINILLRNFILINLITIVFTQQNPNVNINKYPTNIIKLKLKKMILDEDYYNCPPIIGAKIYPNLTIYNGYEIKIDKKGCIDIEDPEDIYDIILVYYYTIDTFKYLFSNCKTIIEIDLSNFNTSSVTSMQGMFLNCENLKYINFGNIDTSSVTDMSILFSSCISLSLINLSSFVTNEVTDMEKMFDGCKSLTSINITNFNTSQVIFMNNMFKECILLKSLNLSSFNTSQVIGMFSLFEKCFSLKSLDLINFNTSNVVSMDYMFANCKSLEFIDISNFDTSNIISMSHMFAYTYSLTSLNLSSFNTSLVKNMGNMFLSSSLISLDLSSFDFYYTYLDSFVNSCSSLVSIKFSNKYKNPFKIEKMFYNCYSLISLDLFNFDFSIIKKMDCIFMNCKSLISLNLPTFNTSSCTNMSYMFYGCQSLESLDLSNFKTIQVFDISSMLYLCSSLTNLEISNFETFNVINMEKMFYGCNKLTSLNLGNFDTSSVLNMESMFSGCDSLEYLNISSFDTSHVTDMNSMFLSCYKLTSLDLSNFNTENIVNMASMFAFCTELKYIKFYNLKKQSINVNNIFFGSNENLIISLNNESKYEVFLPELSSLKCILINDSLNIVEGKQKIIYDKKICIDDCKSDKFYKYEYESYCYKECPKESHLLKNSDYLCEQNKYECIDNYPFLNLIDKGCLKDCISEDFFKEKCSIGNNNISTKNKLINNIINGIEEGSMNELLEDIIFNEKEDLIINLENILYQITSSYNQNNSYYKNISLINLRKCEDVLKGKYNISKNESLIIFKIEKKEENLLSPIIEYEIFNPETYEKLNTEYCNELNEYIDIIIPIIINENELYKYDINNSYYTNICNIENSKDNFDISLYDRRNIYYNYYFSLCPNNCAYSAYNSNEKKVICKCSLRSGIFSFNENNKKIYKRNFENVKNIVNFDILKCYKLLFSKKRIFKIIVNYIFLTIIIIHIISAILFCLKGYNILLNEINQMLSMKNHENEKETNLKIDLKSNSKMKENSKYSLTYSKMSKSQTTIDIKTASNQKSLYLNKNQRKIFKNNINDMKKKAENYTDYELNNIIFEEALENDKRNFCQYYFSLIKIKHPLIFSFSQNKDYNPNVIKICIFFFSLGVFLTINAFFFNDSKMHQIYLDNGKFNFTYNIPHIIYTLIIFYIINIIIKRFFLSQNNILEIKHKSNQYNVNAKVVIVIRYLIIKFTCYFIFSIIFLIICWYYLSCFCIIYKHTQLHLFIITLIGYAFSLIYPFFINLIPGIFRISSLKHPEKCFYKTSQVIFLF